MRRASVFVALIAAALACRREPGVLGLRAAPKLYSPIMNSTVGIGLFPTLPPGAPPGGYSVHWRANYGSFVRWEAPDRRVEPLGPDATLDLGTVYWTYDPKEMGKPKPDVEIDAEASDGRGVVARATVRLAWDKDAARVRE